jgi:hypothetical protein
VCLGTSSVACATGTTPTRHILSPPGGCKRLHSVLCNSSKSGRQHTQARRVPWPSLQPQKNQAPKAAKHYAAVAAARCTLSYIHSYKSIFTSAALPAHSHQRPCTIAAGPPKQVVHQRANMCYVSLWAPRPQGPDPAVPLPCDFIEAPLSRCRGPLTHRGPFPAPTQLCVCTANCACCTPHSVQWCPCRH